MTDSKSLTQDPAVAGSEALDHAREFVELVCQQAPGEYRRLLDSGRFTSELKGGSSFNHGKLQVYAEYRVFDREFRSRFPDATEAASINAFCGLFLKNDISIHNLLEFIEGIDRKALAADDFS